MNEQFNRLIPIILHNEGGFVNDPDDPGGVTKFGISLRFLKGTGDLSFDLDHDGDIDIDDIRALTTSNAADAYRKYFYDPLKLDYLKNAKLALQVFDMAVNSGTRAAVKILQKVSGCKVDGMMGPNTIASANTFLDNIALRYADARKAWYLDLIEEHPNLSKFQAGWINRCNNTYQVACLL